MQKCCQLAKRLFPTIVRNLVRLLSGRASYMYTRVLSLHYQVAICIVYCKSLATFLFSKKNPELLS